MSDIEKQVDNTEAERTSEVVDAHDKTEDITTNKQDAATENICDPKINLGGAVDCQSSCDWSQPSADDTVDEYERVKFCGEESLQGMDADDERGGSSSSDDDWQEVEGLCRSHEKHFYSSIFSY